MANQAEIELYGAPTGNCRRAAIALEEAEIPYTVRFVDLDKGEHKEKPYLDLNPGGQVPTLVENRPDGSRLVLTQSNAISFYAASKAPGKLIPADTDPMRIVVFERYFFFLTDIITRSNAASYLKRNGHRPAGDLLDAQVLQTLRRAEDFAGQSSFIAGSAFSIADVLAYSITAYVNSSITWGELPNLKRWFDMVEGRPTIQRGYRAFDQMI
jgi:GST-like protein